ncbi:ATP-binding protein [Thermanaeromonas sp. C210]|uniref:ATP-binding protein n=1 Tax=Thermanaeromonas sp. C210 TaxID=2731925 RepID=UPI00156651B9|nr:ATP-binding protein [Thermanaeromonas sp. C210]
MSEEAKRLRLSFHGRIIDHLGIQMYQSPVAAIAELIANAWDADAEEVSVALPAELGPEAEIVIRDNGIGMTFEDCQERYLKVGYDRRQKDGGTSLEKKRPLLGRKGIGKFAGFGIAGVIRIETVSKVTGEKTVFELDITKLRGESDGDYVAPPADVEVIEYEGPDENRAREAHGTAIRLRRLTLAKRPAPDAFARSMARRFLLHQRVADFKVLVNGRPLPEGEDAEKVEFVFPRDYRDDQRPEGIRIEPETGWGEEPLGERKIRWRFLFYKDPIDEEELRGVAVFIRGKLAQTPFFFNLVGGLGGQQGMEYLSGQVEADFLDDLATDVTATERQRINWELPETELVLEWGRERVKSLLRIWRDRRAEKRLEAIEARLAPFARRLARLPSSEQKVIKQALNKLARISTISDEQFQEIGEAVLTAWEGGRLKELIRELAESPDMSEARFLEILLEANVLTALHTAEVVKTKLLIIKGLEERIARRDKEPDIRNYIADNPWLFGPEMQTFRRERRIEKLLRDVAAEVGMEADEDWQGRIDLALGSGDQLAIVEFMRPGLTADWDHIFRFERYVRAVRAKLAADTGGPFKFANGYLIADGLSKKPDILSKLQDLSSSGMWAMEWETLLARAAAQWEEFLEVLRLRAPDDERLQALRPGCSEAAAGAASPG